MSWLDPLFFGISSLWANGSLQPKERGVNLVGTSGVTVTVSDNPTQGRTDVTFSSDPYTNGTLPAPSVSWSGGGIGTSGNARPNVLPERDAVAITTDATLTTAKTYAVSTDKKFFRIVIEMTANRTDVDGDGAYFMRKAVFKRSGSSLTVVRADGDIDGPQFTGTSSTWTCTIVASGTNVLVKVQGAAAKTISWSMVKESVEES